MKQVFLVLILIALGVWAYLRYRGNADSSALANEPQPAAQGTLFVLQYVSIPAEHGVIGFEPGREVHFVRADPAKGMLVVTDGEYTVEMQPSQLTNDLGIAAIARKGDEESQHQIIAYIEHERAVYEAVTRANNIRDAKELERVTKHLPPGETVPPNRL